MVFAINYLYYLEKNLYIWYNLFCNIFEPHCNKLKYGFGMRKKSGAKPPLERILIFYNMAKV